MNGSGTCDSKKVLQDNESTEELDAKAAYLNIYLVYFSPLYTHEHGLSTNTHLSVASGILSQSSATSTARNRTVFSATDLIALSAPSDVIGWHSILG